MLETLRLQNIAIIESAEVSFRKGLNILSGETGAGKSIILSGISLLLGSRASADLIRAGCEEAVVSGLFDIHELPKIKERLQGFGFDSSTDQLLIRRTVHRGGRHRIHINGEVATLSVLESLCEGLIDLCGQHEHQSLLKSAKQLELLDRYGNCLEERESFASLFEKVSSLQKEIEALEQAEAERLRRSDFLNFQIDELQGAGLQPAEDETLQKEKQLLQSIELRRSGLGAIHDILEGEENGVLLQLRAAVAKLKSLSEQDSALRPLFESSEHALFELEEVALGLNRYGDGLILDPERLAQVQERLSLLASLRRKYGSSVSEMIQTLDKLEGEREQLGRSGAALSELQGKCAALYSELKQKGLQLSKKRKKAAALFSDSVTQELQELNMADAKLRVELAQKENLSEWTAAGGDTIQFITQTNRGEEARMLSKIASGGELSRTMLAIRRVIADRGGIGVYLFDEIDAGIGGQTAFQVGKKLKSVARYNQVICITHLPQVASFADHHFTVRKRIEGKRTVAELVELSPKERQEELARMLAGPKLTPKSLANATELMGLARG